MQPKKKICALCGVPQFIYKCEGRDRYCRLCWEKVKYDRGEVKPTPSKRQPISPRSSKQEKLNQLYLLQRKSFLERRPNCEAKIEGHCSARATTVHHKRGRGEYLLDESTWLPACMGCHEFIERNVQFAYDMGFSQSRLSK